MAPRTGPQGITLQDVVRVASGGSRAMNAPQPPSGDRGGYTFTTRTAGMPSTPAAFDATKIYASLIGAPSTGYGKTYGGFKTAGQLQDAVLGQAYQLPQIIALAQQQAAAEEARLNELATTESSLIRPGTIGFDAYKQAQEDVRRYGGPLGNQPEVQAARQALNVVTGQQEAAANAAPTVAQMQRDIGISGGYAPSRRGWLSPNVADLIQLRNLGAIPTQQESASLALARQKAEEDLRNASYAAHMNRMNTMAIPSGREEVNSLGETRADVKAAGREFVPDPAASLAISQMTPEIRGLIQPQYERGVVPYQQLATELSGIPISQLAQQIATESYGQNPFLAQGMFTSKVDLDYANRQRQLEQEALRQQGIDFGMSTDEAIYQKYGADAYQQYQDAKTQGAYEKAFGPAQTAEEEAFDAQAMNTLGVVPAAIAGDFPASKARELLSDPGFVQILQDSRTAVQDYEAVSSADKKAKAAEIAAEFEAQSGDPVAAQILYNALLSFDYLYQIGE